ncbi:MAG TPA: S41 family peptidase [Pyrinomonadaceae bacterium]|jgi:C-terminal processing protease CtpA/Prc|nr:S41 family peptidase [Pyrinomonadaceae bacterium]
MKLLLTLLLTALFALTAYGQAENAVNPLAEFNLGFEKSSDAAKLPDKWAQWGTGFSLKTDSTEKKAGNVSLSLEPLDKTASFGAAAYQIPALYEGKEIELRGFLKLKDVSDGFAGLFLRVDGENGVMEFDNMQSRDIKGSADWTQYSITLPLPADATTIYVGALLSGKGKLWVDDLQVLIDGKDVKEVKRRSPVVFKASLDKEFDAGSKIGVLKLEKRQVEDLAVLGKVWGFLKYYHPAIARGDHNWDYELFRILPKILAAKNKNDRNEILFAWAESLGTFSAGPQPAAPKTPVKDGVKDMAAPQTKLSPDLSWLTAKTLGDKLAGQLNTVKSAKRENKHYYIGFAPNIGNPQFKNESAYKAMAYPDAGYRLLSLFRYWNIIKYFFPNRHLIGENWNNVLAEFVPLFANAADELEYKKAALALIARIHDTHANIWGSDPTMAKYRGLNLAPVNITFVEDKAVVTHYWDEELAEKAGLKIGDVIEAVNGKKVSDIIKEKLRLTPASNYPTQLRDIARFLLYTNENFVNVRYMRDGVSKEARVETSTRDKYKLGFADVYNKKGEAYKLIGTDVGYLYPGSLKEGEIAKIIPEIAKTKGLVVDLRTYPSDFIVFSLGEFLLPKPTDFVKFTGGSLADPGLFNYTEPLKVGKENSDHYKGKVVILINELTQSQAEYTTMALRTAPGAVVIGSTTAGADGNVSQFSLPGGISTMISGIGIYYPDGRETQRIGIVPDIVMTPTIKGIKEGKDELLDKALQIINSK